MSDIVCGKLYAGFGNNIYQILATIQYSLSEKMDYYMIIPPLKHKDHNARVLGGHYALFTKEHKEYGLPHPIDLPSILPNIKWRKRALPGSEIYDEHAPFYTEYYYPTVNYVKCLFETSKVISEYIQKKYIKKVDKDINSIAIHFRVPQKADNFGMVNPSLKWYAKAIKSCLSRKEENKIYVVTGNKEKNNDIIRELKTLIKKDLKFISVHDEPMYIDFFVMAKCKNLICTNSTFSFSAGLISDKRKLLVTPKFFDESDDVLPSFAQYFYD